MSFENGDRLALALAGLLVTASGLLVAIEASIARAGRIRALAWADEGRPGGARLARLLEAPEEPLAVLVLLRMAARVSAATMVGIVGWRAGDAFGAVVAVAVLLGVVLVVGEMGPRRIAERRPEAFALRSAAAVSALARIRPLAALARAVAAPASAPRPAATNGAGDDHGGGALFEPADGDELDPEEQQLIHSIFEFGDTVVREVMVPRTDMVTVASDTTIDATLDIAIPAGFSRLPVFRDTSDSIIGLVFVKDLIRAARRGRGHAPVTEVLRRAVFVPEQKRVAELLREMQTRKFHMAIAVDEYGGTAGLVTLEDVLEEIVGEIVDEYDVEEPHVEQLGGGIVRVAGRTPIDEINELLSLDLPSTEWDTVGGLMFDLVGHVPAEGETVSFQGIEFEAERVQGRRIVSVRIHADEDRERVEVTDGG